MGPPLQFVESTILASILKFEDLNHRPMKSACLGVDGAQFQTVGLPDPRSGGNFLAHAQSDSTQAYVQSWVA